jgi:hypothetical protein
MVMRQFRTIHAMLASAALALAVEAVCLDSAHADSQQPVGIMTSGYSLLRVPQPKGSPSGSPAGASSTANSSSASSAPAARVPFPVPPKTPNAGGASAGGAASSQAGQPNAGPYVPTSKRPKTRRMPLGW